MVVKFLSSHYFNLLWQIKFLITLSLNLNSIASMPVKCRFKNVFAFFLKTIQVFIGDVDN